MSLKKPNIRKIDPLHPEKKVIEEAAAIIQGGGIVAFPTRCLYGLGTDAFNDQAVQRLFEIKQRPFDKPILVLINSRQDLNRLVRRIPSTATVLMDHFWPGNITLLFEARSTLPAGLTAGTGKIGVRMAGHPAAAALIQRIGTPVTGTSANLSLEAGCHRIFELKPEIVHNVDLILDAGPLKCGPGSTIIDVTNASPVMIREGVIREAEINDVLQKNKYRACRKKTP